MEALLRTLPGLVAVYRLGSVSAPGISDLDRIAVVDGRHPVPAVWNRLSRGSRYLAMHTPFLVDRATFARHRWFAYLEPLELAFGNPVELDERPSPEYSEPLIGAESLTVCLLRLVKQISTRRVKVRQLLCELNNVRHGLRLAGLGEREAASAWRLAEDVARLRKMWFTSPHAQQADLTNDVAGRALPALLEALWALGERSELPQPAAASMMLGAPWSNVALLPTESLSLIHIPSPRDTR
jgi:hypothetical protein